MLLEHKQTPEALEKAEELYRIAISKGNIYAIKNLALLLARKRTPEALTEADSLFREAIRLGVNNANIYYAFFLMIHGNLESAKKYEQAHMLEVDSNDSNSDSDFIDAEELDIEILPRKQGTDIQLVENSSIASPSYAALNPVLAKDPHKETVTESKKYKKMLARIEKQREQAKLNDKKSEPSIKRQISRTYKDVCVYVLPDANLEVTTNEESVQRLISMLANGEIKRANFESIDHDCYSMRLTKKDRLVFQITEGNLTTGVQSIKIITAKGHYDHLKNRLKQTTETQLIEWSK